MLDSMHHESFYESRSCHDEELGIAAGWVAFKGTGAEKMPVWNGSGDICLILLADRMVCGRNGRDIENGGAIVEWFKDYEKHGLTALERFNGWFCGILLDHREKRICVFNDRYGINRIYFYESPKGFYFASEAKALLRILPETRELDGRGLAEYFACGCVMQNRTVFSRLELFHPGSVWTFAPGQQGVKRIYFQKERWEELQQVDSEEYYERLRAIWARSLPTYWEGDERVGLSLTGGVDSRMILASVPERVALPCYTFGGMYRDCADVRVSRKVARVCGRSHETILLGSEFFREFPSLAEKSVYVTDGTLDVTGATDLYVHRRVREIAPVRITGLYGGEILRSLVAFKPMPQARDHLNPEFAAMLQTAHHTYAGELKGHRQSFIAFKQAPWHIYSRLSIERSQVTIRTPYFENDLVALSFQAPQRSLSYEPALRLITEENPRLKGIATDRAFEARTGFSIRRIRHWQQQFTYRAEYAYDYGMPQWLARIDGSLRPLRIERAFLGRHKYYHFRLWYRDQLREYVSSILLDSKSLSRAYLKREAVERLVRSHLSGRGNYTLEIHRLLTVELIQRKLTEGQVELGTSSRCNLAQAAVTSPRD